MKVARKARPCPKGAAKTKSLKISASTRYALRILADVAQHTGDGEPRTEKAIAERQGVSMKFLSRLVIPLRRAGLLDARQGSREGFVLCKKPSAITLLDIVETMQGPVTILDCLDEAVPCDRSPECMARKVWCRVNAALAKSLKSITLADALNG